MTTRRRKRPLDSKESNDLELEKKSSRKGLLTESVETVKSSNSMNKSENEGSPSTKRHKHILVDPECCLAGEPVPVEEARRRWPARYEKHLKDDDADKVLLASCHYEQALVDGIVYHLLDDAVIESEEGKPDYIGRIVEFFQSVDNQPYFTIQWFFKAEDTVIKTRSELIDTRRVFWSDFRDDNPLACIKSKIKVVEVPLDINLSAVPDCDFYYNLKYSIEYSTFSKLDTGIGEVNPSQVEYDSAFKARKLKMTLLDLYSGCGGMSTGLCLGASISGVNLVTKWAVDMNEHACKSLKFNHPETEVRNESAEDFLKLLKKWPELCERYCSKPGNLFQAPGNDADEEVDDGPDDQTIFEVEKIVGICFGDPKKKEKKTEKKTRKKIEKESELLFKVRWKGFDSSADSWEPFDNLDNCEESIRNFVISGFESQILPFPGDVDVICGGPPCQGISGFNRFRDSEKPLDGPLNHQLEVYMDIVNYLKPKFVLMENVVDLVRFADGFLGRHALSRLVSMNYQTRLGLMTAGCYGLPQFRMRVFIWGACASEKLPQYPLPTHEVVVRGIFPNEFETNVVAYSEDDDVVLKRPLLLEDAISDLPSVMNNEMREEMKYVKDAKTEFQQYIRLGRGDDASNGEEKALLYDHIPLNMNADDYERSCWIPKEKDACFRNMPGVLVGDDNRVRLDPNMERILLPSGKPLVPNYAITYINGTSTKPFARLWWDETVSTVVTRAEPHNQRILHPNQDRVLSIRENARLQGFPDYYRLFGPVKERYIQVGNAVAVPVARALGYALGMARQGKCDDCPMFILPPHFPKSSSASKESAE